ncbi:MAG: hypothetical protein N3D71_09595 [Burkholderiaceae bacterium]|nr:hypothetical protein [Burkholderiaceae bacterium]
MKRIPVLLAATAIVSGCAALGSGSTAESEIDSAYVAAVESAAKRFGTQVIWVNYPRKSASPTR